MQVKMCGDEPVVPVNVVIDSEGTYFGWQDTGSDYIAMIYHHLGLLEMCFPYGSKAEIAAEKGNIVRLKVTRRDSEAI